MTPGSAGQLTGGFFLSLLTESFAVRALLGSLVAAGFAVLAVRYGVRTRRARRIVVLAPVLTAAAAAAASLRDAEAYLPQLWVPSTGRRSGQVLQLLGELRFVSTDRGVDLLVLAWAVTAGVLLGRRAVGVVAARRLLRRATAGAADERLAGTVARLAATMGLRRVRVLLLDDCPGGAFTTGTRRPVVVVDPAVVAELDEDEVEGLLAHELAHVARRDPFLGVVVGVFTDLTFFLPPVRLAARWLHREQEESADELASTHTRRPVALASSILKVWHRATPSAFPRGACAAVPAGQLGNGRAELSGAAQAVAVRVERLVAPAPAVTVLRRRAEAVLAAALLVAALAVALFVPRWIATDLDAYSLSFGYVPPPVSPLESPAFATFRALAPARPASPALSTSERMPPAPSRSARAARARAACPCIETQAQLAAGEPAATPARVEPMAWRGVDRATWEVDAYPESLPARPLWLLRDGGPEVGFFVVGRSEAS